MPCQILVSNRSGIAKAEIVCIVSGDHVFSARETLERWIEEGNDPIEWKGTFVCIRVTDKNKEDIAYLSETIDGINNRYHFIEPDADSDFYKQLSSTGKVEDSFINIEKYIRERY